MGVCWLAPRKLFKFTLSGISENAPFSNRMDVMFTIYLYTAGMVLPGA